MIVFVSFLLYDQHLYVLEMIDSPAPKCSLLSVPHAASSKHLPHWPLCALTRAFSETDGSHGLNEVCTEEYGGIQPYVYP